MLLNGKAPLPGQIVKLPNLGKTFRELATKGKDGFYKGRVAEAIVELIKSKGGVMELEDLANHDTTFVEPLKYTYAGEVNVYEEYLASRAKLIDPTKCNPSVVHGNPVNSSDTVYFTVTDQWGNACSYIQSNYAGKQNFYYSKHPG
ncbi:hypothetical protein PM082_002657 [Marasmius tenuissimus]|nr:hypothetical protein PM082_002657 [Marasmius tenuissimus]